MRKQFNMVSVWRLKAFGKQQCWCQVTPGVYVIAWYRYGQVARRRVTDMAVGYVLSPPWEHSINMDRGCTEIERYADRAARCN